MGTPTNEEIAARMSWALFASERRTRTLREQLATGIEAAIHLYYEDFTDADVVEGDYLTALRNLAPYLDEELEDLVAKVEDEIHRASGGRRTFLSLLKRRAA